MSTNAAPSRAELEQQVARLKARVDEMEARERDAAGSTTTTTRGEPGNYTAEEMDRAMGLRSVKPPIRLEGTRLVLEVLTPEQARAVLAQRAKEQTR